MSSTEPQTTNQAVEAQTSVPQAEDQPKGEKTLVTSEIGKDVPNPVAVEGVEGDQEKAGEKGEDEEDDDDDDVVDEPKMAKLAPLYASGRKENPVVVDDEDDYEVMDDEEDEDDDDDDEDSEEEEDHKGRLAAFYNARPEELEDDEEEYDEEADEGEPVTAEPSSSAAVKRSAPDTEGTSAAVPGETDGPSEAKKTKLD